MELIRRIAGRIPPTDAAAMRRAKERLDSLTKPQGSLGMLEDLVKIAAGITGKDRPSFPRKEIIVMAADHGVAKTQVSAYPQAVTGQMVVNILRGGAAINVLARHVGARIVVVDMGVASSIARHKNLISAKIGKGTANMAEGPAMSRKDAVKALETGMEILEREAKKGLDMVGTGDMGIGNTTASTAIVSVLTATPPREITGRGTGIEDSVLAHKTAVIEMAIGKNVPTPDDPIGVLHKVGGFEIGGLAGVMLAAASRRIPIVVDGLVSGAAALIASGIAPNSRDYMIASHCSTEPAHRVALVRLGLKPVLNLSLRLGEGTGAALAMNIIDAATKIAAEMSTFDEAGVSGPEGT